VKKSFMLLALSDLALLFLTAALGLMVEGSAGFVRHFLLGVLAGLFTCFVHVIVFVFFIVQDKVVTQSVLHHRIVESHARHMMALKSRAVRLSVLGSVSMIVVVALGAAIEVGVDPSVHFAVALAGIGVNAFVFARQIIVIDECQRMLADAFDPSPGPGV
jgi:hypothetical protein